MNAVTPVAATGGSRITLTYDETIVTYDPATGALTLPDPALADGCEMILTVVNADGEATSAFKLTALALVLPPRAIGTIADVILSAGTFSTTVETRAAFAGDELTFDLAQAPAGITIDPASGLVTITAIEDFNATPVTVRASNPAGSATLTFAVTAQSNATDFSDPARMGDIGFISILAPEWYYVADGYGQLIPAGKSRAHGDWSKARGDGLYRTLVRWSGASLTPTVDRRFTFGARIRRNGNDWFGVRIEVFATTAGEKRLHIREYTGSTGVTRSLATVNVGWEYDTWYWYEVEIAGTSVRGRLYPEHGTAPAWQVAATTSYTEPGAFGPGGFPALDQSPVIDIRRLEYLPLGE